MNVFPKYISKMALAAVALWAVGCNDIELDGFQSPVVDDSSITGSTSDLSVSTLTFSWEAVSGVTQYGYVLYNDEGVSQRSGLTSETSVTFTKLTSNTTYVLEVEAYGTNGETTKRFTITAKTDAVVTLDTPDVSLMTTSQENGKIVIQWVAVANADSYNYYLYSDEGDVLQNGTTTETTVSFSLDAGTYQLGLTAESEDEAFTTSGVALFTFDRTRELQSSKSVTYTRGDTGDKWALTMSIYDDGAYVVENIFGAEGYNLEFAIAEDNSISILNAAENVRGYDVVYYGTGENDYVAYYCTTGNAFSWYEESKADGKVVTLYAIYDLNSTDHCDDTIAWDVPRKAITEDDVIGTYRVTYFYLSDYALLSGSSSWTTLENTGYLVTIESTGEPDELEISGLLTGNMSDNTTYFPVSDYAKYDTLIATLSGGKLIFEDQDYLKYASLECYEWIDYDAQEYEHSYEMTATVSTTDGGIELDEEYFFCISYYSSIYDYYGTFTLEKVN